MLLTSRQLPALSSYRRRISSVSNDPTMTPTLCRFHDAAFRLEIIIDGLEARTAN
jgi:hypothetical protein